MNTLSVRYMRSYLATALTYRQHCMRIISLVCVWMVCKWMRTLLTSSGQIDLYTLIFIIKSPTGWYLLLMCLIGIPATRNATHGVKMFCDDFIDLSAARSKTIHFHILIEIRCKLTYYRQKTMGNIHTQCPQS